MFDLSDPNTFWLNMTNIALGNITCKKNSRTTL
jgi:hypothetical protein